VTELTELAHLNGSELSAVAFVRDYVEFSFDGAVLRFLAPPVISSEGRRIAFPAAGSRDALCSLIGQTVDRTEDTPDRLVLTLSSRTKVEISKASRGAGPEVAHLVPVRNGVPDIAAMATWENVSPTRDDLHEA
jgi:hypothetical protein